MKFHAVGMTDQGDTRERNEDAFGIFNQERFYVLADGVGGHQGGEIASNETVSQLFYGIQRLQDKLNGCSNSDLQSLLKFNISEANQIVINKAEAISGLKGMASTFCFVFFHNDRVFYSHYGDSRIYRLRDNSLVALTKDHTLAQELQDANKAVTHERQKSTLTKAIGVTESGRASVKVEKLKEGDVFLLCSDGLLEGLNQDEIFSYLSQSKSLHTKLKELILGARNRGAKDNITTILIEVS